MEATFEKQLHGNNGFRQILVDAQGRPVQKPGVFGKDLEMKAPTPGDDVILSLDMKVQKVAEAALAGQEGAVVAIDPHSGDIIALVSAPAFDPNLFARGITEKQYADLEGDPNRPLYDRALRGEYSSGSTIKPGLALGALTDGVLDPDKPVFCPGYYHLAGGRHIWHDANHERHGAVDLDHAIARSCDVYFYGVAHEMGIDRISAWLPLLGFGRPTGIDIGGEKPGLVPSRAWKETHFSDPGNKVWFPGETVNLGIGQGYFLVTPLQLAHYTSIIATQGRIWRPRLVTGLRSPDTGRIEWLPPVYEGSLSNISADSWKRVIHGMIGATTYPNATAYYPMRGSVYTIAGKTGTDQVVNESVTGNLGEEHGFKNIKEKYRDNAWFIAFAPAEAPRIAIAVIVEHAGYGSDSAAPVARKVMDAYLLGPDGKVLPEAPRGPYSEPADLKPKKELVAAVPARPRAAGGDPTGDGRLRTRGRRAGRPNSAHERPAHDLRRSQLRVAHPPHPHRRGASTLGPQNGRTVGDRARLHRGLRVGRALQRLGGESADGVAYGDTARARHGGHAGAGPGQSQLPAAHSHRGCMALVSSSCSQSRSSVTGASGRNAGSASVPSASSPRS